MLWVVFNFVSYLQTFQAYDISDISSFSCPRKMAEDAFQCAAGSAGKVPPRSRDTRNPSPDFSTLILILGFNDRQVLRGGWLKHVENSINKKLPARNVDTVVFVSLIGSTSTVDNLIQFIKQKKSLTIYLKGTFQFQNVWLLNIWRDQFLI